MLFLGAYNTNHKNNNNKKLVIERAVTVIKKNKWFSKNLNWNLKSKWVYYVKITHINKINENIKEPNSR